MAYKVKRKPFKRFLGGFFDVGHLKQSQIPDSRFNKMQLKAGMKVEREHTNNMNIAKAIAKAHLKEDKDYYKKLRLAGL